MFFAQFLLEHGSSTATHVWMWAYNTNCTGVRCTANMNTGIER